MRPWATAPEEARAPSRTPRDHVILLDGTLSSLAAGCETNVGLTYRLLQEKPEISVYYEPGLQWQGWHRGHELIAGVGINRQIKRAYGWLAQSYCPGDRIFLIGYSRGAYAVRALAGLLDRIGLLREDCADQACVDRAYDHYRFDPTSAEARSFSARVCHPKVTIKLVAVYDTVRGFGLQVPVLWRLLPQVHVFKNNRLSGVVEKGVQALALHETRRAFEPVLWEVQPHRVGDVEQRWFGGSHGDVGGQLSGFDDARPRSNIPLVWVLGRLEECGLSLPADALERFDTDADAPSVGSWRRWGKFFWSRRKRVAGRHPTEVFDPSLYKGSPPADPRVPLGTSERVES